MRRMLVGNIVVIGNGALLLPSSSSLSFYFLFLSRLSSRSSMATLPDADPQSTSSHMMKTTKRGRPFLKVRRLALLYQFQSY